MTKALNKNRKSTSKFISLILRHRPEIIGIKLDEHGWANVDDLLEGVGKTHEIDRQILKQIVAEDEKQRYSFSKDGGFIRANQGHSIDVDVELKKARPPAVLFHGTAEKNLPSIKRKGLIAKSRLYVHLSNDIETAKKVAGRHGKPRVLKVDCQAMSADRFSFYLSANQIWMTERVPLEYLQEVKI